MKSHLVLLLLAVLCLAAPIQTTPAQSVTPPSDSAQQVSRVLHEWSKDWMARDADSISALYAQDAIIYPALDRAVSRTGADFNGPNAIRDYFRQLFKRLADPKGDKADPGLPQASEGLAFDDGFLQYEVRGKCQPSKDVGGGPCVLKGYSLTVLGRGSDSKWLILRQSFTQLGLGSTIYTPR